MTKMTIATKFDEVAKMIRGEESALSVEDALAFLDDRKDKAQKKAGTRKPTANQKENEGIKGIILDNLTAEGQTVSELMANTSDLAGYSNQRLSALLRQLVLDGSVVKTVDKKKSFFSLA